MKLLLVRVPRYEGLRVSAISTLQSWKSSPGHNAVIVNQGIWKDYRWNAIGIGLYAGFAVVWFGVESDQ